jgi:cytoskeletal protein CcmA (bactofilin family)
MSREPHTAPPPPSRRFTDAQVQPATVIVPGVKVRGELTGDDPVELAGSLEGDSRVGALFMIREGGRVAGAVEATSVVIAGELTGPTVVADKVEIRATARVHADVRARVVAIAEGALFDGKVDMRGAEAGGLITFKEQRRGPTPADGR